MCRLLLRRGREGRASDIKRRAAFFRGQNSFLAMYIVLASLYHDLFVHNIDDFVFLLIRLFWRGLLSLLL